jgi:hypothetical protein
LRRCAGVVNLRRSARFCPVFLYRQGPGRYPSSVNSPGPDPKRFVIVPNRAPWHLSGVRVALAAAWLLSLALVGYFAARSGSAAGPAAGGSVFDFSRERAAQAAQIKDLQQQVTTLKRSDQISRNANIDLQSTLADREEEISGLRADIAFYERLVGSTGQRHGLNVHEAVFTAEAGGTWHYVVTVTQNLNRGSITQGQMRFSVDGVRAGKLLTAKWDDLLQKPNAPGQPFSFRYFQQLEGSVMVPVGMIPQHVHVVLNAQGNTVDQVFPWSTKNPGE